VRETAAVVRDRVRDPERRRRRDESRDEGGSGVGARLSAATETLEEGGASVGERLSAAKETIGEKAGALKRGATSGAKAVTEGAGSAREAISQGSSTAASALERGQSGAERLSDRADLRRRTEAGLQAARSNPVPIAMGALALGALAGALLPSTPAEDERIGSMADDLKQEGLDAGGEAVRRGRDAAEAAIRGDESEEPAQETPGSDATDDDTAHESRHGEASDERPLYGEE
jgi:hypothetical protein